MREALTGGLSQPDLLRRTDQLRAHVGRLSRRMDVVLGGARTVRGTRKSAEPSKRSPHAFRVTPRRAASCSGCRALDTDMIVRRTRVGQTLNGLDPLWLVLAGSVPA